MEVDKIARQTCVHGVGEGGRSGRKGRWLERREKGRIGDSFGEWDGGREEGWMWEQGSIYLN